MDLSGGVIGLAMGEDTRDARGYLAHGKGMIKSDLSIPPLNSVTGSIEETLTLGNFLLDPELWPLPCFSDVAL